MADPIELVTTPRVVGLEAAVAAREPELRALWAALDDTGALGGRPLMPRHLRRRATSHRRRRNMRRPNVRLQQQWLIVLRQRQREQQQQQQQGGSDDSVNEQQQQPVGAAAQGAPQQQQQQQQQQQPSVIGASDQDDEDMAEAPPNGPSATSALPSQSWQRRPTNRAMRRRPALVQAGCEASCMSDPASDVFEGPRRLETHVWHARRMSMRVGYGHLLAWKAVGRGHGSRALLRSARRGTLIHDASYWVCLQLEGPEEALAATAAAASAPGHWQAAWATPGFREGSIEAPLVLQLPGSFPARAVGPAMAMMLPAWASPGSGGYENSSMQAHAKHPSPPARRMWVWVHGGTASDAAAALRAAAAAAAPSGSNAAAAGSAVCVESLAPWLRRLEVCGGAADATLRAILSVSCATTIGLEGASIAGYDSDGGRRPRTPGGSRAEGSVADSSAAAPSVTGPGAARFLFSARHLARLPEGAAFGVELTDPRLARPLKHAGHIPGPDPAAAAAAFWGATGGDEDGSDDRGDGGGGGAAAVGRTRARWPAAYWDADGAWLAPAEALLSDPASVPRPLTEDQVSGARQVARAASLGLPPPPGPPRGGSGGRRAPHFAAPLPSVSGKGSAVGAGKKGEAGGKSPYGITSTYDEPDPPSTTCPALLVRRGGLAGGAGPWRLPRWSVVLPAGWALPVWLALAYSGARPAGQLEWSWLCGDLGVRHFPSDFPDSPAAARAWAEETARQQEAAARRPRGRLRHPLLQPHLDWAAAGRPDAAAAAAAAGIAQGPAEAAIAALHAGRAAAKEAARRRRRAQQEQARAQPADEVEPPRGGSGRSVPVTAVVQTPPPAAPRRWPEGMYVVRSATALSLAVRALFGTASVDGGAAGATSAGGPESSVGGGSARRAQQRARRLQGQRCLDDAAAAEGPGRAAATPRAGNSRDLAAAVASGELAWVPRSQLPASLNNGDGGATTTDAGPASFAGGGNGGGGDPTLPGGRWVPGAPGGGEGGDAADGGTPGSRRGWQPRAPGGRLVAGIVSELEQVARAGELEAAAEQERLRRQALRWSQAGPGGGSAGSDAGAGGGGAGASSAGARSCDGTAPEAPAPMELDVQPAPTAEQAVPPQALQQQQAIHPALQQPQQPQQQQQQQQLPPAVERWLHEPASPAPQLLRPSAAAAPATTCSGAPLRFLMEVQATPSHEGVCREGAEILAELDCTGGGLESDSADAAATAAEEGHGHGSRRHRHRRGCHSRRHDSRRGGGEEGATQAPLRLLGYITSGATRGATDSPGGAGLCCLESVWSLRTRQALVRAPGGRGGWQQGALRVFVRNPGSPALVPARLLVPLMLQSPAASAV